MPETPLRSLLGIDLPIIQAPMAGVQGSALAAAVSNAGGLPQVLRAVPCPVIAAGGIADADGVAAALALGATAVQLGTSFLLCDEATTPALHRAALQQPGATHTALTNVFTDRPARSIVNRVMTELGCLHPQAPPFPWAANEIAALRAAAEARGSADFSPLWAGQNTSGCQAVPAAALLRQLTQRGPA